MYERCNNLNISPGTSLCDWLLQTSAVPHTGNIFYTRERAVLSRSARVCVWRAHLAGWVGWSWEGGGGGCVRLLKPAPNTIAVFQGLRQCSRTFPFSHGAWKDSILSSHLQILTNKGYQGLLPPFPPFPNSSSICTPLTYNGVPGVLCSIFFLWPLYLTSSDVT